MQRSMSSLLRQLPRQIAKGRMMTTKTPLSAVQIAQRNQSIRSLATSAATAGNADESMFCFQCEQTKNRTGCVEIGVCGKTPEVAKLQDLSMYMCKANAFYLNELYEADYPIDQRYVDKIIDVLFATVTNVNFDADRFIVYLHELMQEFNEVKAIYEKEIPTDKQKTMVFGVHEQTNYSLKEYSQEELEDIATTVGVRQHQSIYGPSLAGVREMMTYGLKGSATYWAHAERLGQTDLGIQRDFIKHLAWLVNTENKVDDNSLNEALGAALAVGELNLRVMDKLDNGHRELLGVPTPGKCRMYPKPGPCILVSGHDLQDLLAVLEATKDKGINVYTHGEMLPAHGYPKLREYKDRIYTLNAVGWPGAKHINAHKKGDLDVIVQQALEMKGFSEAECEKQKRADVNVGFGRETIIGAAGTILEEIEKGTLKHVFLVGGCDGSENKRNWFTQMVDATPDESLVLTLGCAKYRFNTQKDYGTLAETGIPRLLDMGQCNDAYGAVKVAMALADALKTDINSLPLSLAISWFEQKAVAVLLTMLHLGIQNIRLGPVMPGFLTEEVYDILHEKFNVLPLDMKKKRDPVADVKLMMDNQSKQLAASGAGKRKRAPTNEV